MKKICRSVLLVLSSASVAACSQTNHLPTSAEAAFAYPKIPLNERTFTQDFVVTASLSEATRAAAQALDAMRFEQRPENSTNERRCGQRFTGWYEWAVWGCFYFAPGSESGTVRGRVITENWRSFGLSTRQEWDSLLAAAFQGRLRALQQENR
jgi:hypothetical protein